MFMERYYSYTENYSLGPWIGFLVLLVGFCMYFFPTLVAFFRHHHNRMAILMLNIFLGYTGLGWIIALIWSFTMVQKRNT